jgi:serine/threonine protein kinase
LPHEGDLGQIAGGRFSPALRELVLLGVRTLLELLNGLAFLMGLFEGLSRLGLGRHADGQDRVSVFLGHASQACHVCSQTLAIAFARTGILASRRGGCTRQPGRFAFQAGACRLPKPYESGLLGFFSQARCERSGERLSRRVFSVAPKGKKTVQLKHHGSCVALRPRQRKLSVGPMAVQVPSRKYRIERYLAEGGMGAIYVGKKIGPGGFEKEVVLKQLLPEFTSRPEFRDLFFREAKISATLDHQNIVRTFDLVNSNDRLFIVMEYVRGADLRTIAWRARRRKPMSTRAILHVALEILAGLAYVHSRRSPSGEPLGISHRDLSPSNILCSGEGEVKLSDFGIAKAVTYSSVFYRVRGKVGYMSPEMARNQPLDARSDLFSLGVSIYETLIGERIYTGDLNTPPDKIYAQVVPRLNAKCVGLPLELQVVLDRALAIHPEARYPDAESFASALRQIAHARDLLCSAPQLAAELREIMGPNAEDWLSDERDPTHSRNARAAQPSTLSGSEADSIVESGLVQASGEDVDLEDLVTPPARTSASAPATTTRLSGKMAAVLPAAEPVPVLPRDNPAWSPQMAFEFPSIPPQKPSGGVAAIKRSRRAVWLLVLLAIAMLLGFGLVRFVLGSGLARSARASHGSILAIQVGGGHRQGRVCRLRPTGM